MDKKLFYKLLAIGAMMLLLGIPLAHIESQIRDRSLRQASVVENIADGAARAQTLVGPFIALRYQESEAVEAQNNKGEAKSVRRNVIRVLPLPPDTLEIKGRGEVETRHRGIYEARLFHLDLNIAGTAHIDPEQINRATHRASQIEAWLVFAVSDPRGLDLVTPLRVNDRETRLFAPTDVDNPFAGGNHGLANSLPFFAAPLGAFNPQRIERYTLSLPLRLTGSERLDIAPVAERNSIELSSNWRHPNFGGRFLPREHRIDGDGFAARWEVSKLARNFQKAIDPEHYPESLSLQFINPVNVYLQAERAVKYGLLFIVLTFAAFFLCELLRRRPLHPMQYLLVGLALAIFFLLLIALSEHLAFASAYMLSASACILLIGTYLGGPLGSRKLASIFAGGIAVLYGVLFGVLRSEDNALLMGTALLFIALAATMLATRRLDWYRISELTAPADKA